MKKDNILYSVIGVLLGFIVGFAFANVANQRGYAAQTSCFIKSSTRVLEARWF